MKVSRTHYDALQDRLNQKYPNRDLEEYDGSLHCVLSDKLDILKSTTPTESSSPQHPDNSEDQADDGDDPEPSKGGDSELESLFPATVRFLDLSSLELQDEADRFPSPLLLREEYDYISKLINKRPHDASGSVIISGQPGTGEVLISLSCRI